MKLFQGLLPMSYLEKGDICSFFSSARKSQISPKSLQYNECPNKHSQKHNELERSVYMPPAVGEGPCCDWGWFRWRWSIHGSNHSLTLFLFFCGIVLLLAEMVVTGLLRWVIGYTTKVSQPSSRESLGDSKGGHLPLLGMKWQTD